MLKKLPKEYQTAIQAAVEAGIAILEVFHSNDFGLELKSDNSPLTKADLISTQIISSYLVETNIPIIGEEDEPEDYEIRKNWEQVWIVDPLDGTKEFVNKTSEFTVNIGLVNRGIPVFGIIYVPVTKELYFGGKEWRSFKIIYDKSLTVGEQLKTAIQLPIEATPNEKIIVTGGKSTQVQFFEESPRMKKFNKSEFIFVRLSSSLKFCRIAEGKMDIYPRNYPCMEWDTAAGHAIVNGIGKQIYDIATDEVITYNKENLYNPYFLVI